MRRLLPPGRPLSITALGWLFVAVGVAGLIASALPLVGNGVDRSSAGEQARAAELGLVVAVRVLAVVGGALVLYGVSWARWLLVLWMAWHVALSLGHSAGELTMHALLFGVVVFVLFRRQASEYFRGVPALDDSAG